MPTIAAAVGGNYTHSLNYTVTGQSISGNYSTVYFEYVIHRNVAAGSGAFADSRQFNASLAGQGFSNTRGFDFRSYADAVMVSGTVTVGHDANGNATITGAFDGPITFVSSGMPRTSGSGSASLPTIPRQPGTPTIGTLTQQSVTSANLTWSAPASDGGTPITGYRIQYATNPSFTGASILDVPASTSRLLDSLTPGQYYARVAATNAAGTSGYSDAASVVIVAEIGDLDGWSSFGALPSGLTPLVSGALRRGTVYPLGQMAPTGLIREVQQSGSGGPIAAGTLGIQRTFTTLKVGATYRLDGMLLSLQDTTPTGNIYRWAVVGIGAGGNATTSNTSTPVMLPSYTFVATSTTHIIRLELNEAASWSGSGWWEAVALYGVTLTEIPNTSPYRLQDLAYEGPLAKHFSIACDTVGAAWWVDRAGVTRFRQATDQSVITATFTDARAVGALEYVDIAASYDTANVVNALRVTNHGRDAATGNTLDVDYSASDATSAAAWGTHSDDLDISLYTAADPSVVTTRVNELFAVHNTPTVVISSITWNAQENPKLAAQLDVQDRVRVQFRGAVQDSRIVGLKHDWTDTRWMVTLELAVA